MSKPTDNPAAPFKKALAEATRTMADSLADLVPRAQERCA